MRKRIMHKRWIEPIAYIAKEEFLSWEKPFYSITRFFPLFTLFSPENSVPVPIHGGSKMDIDRVLSFINSIVASKQKTEKEFLAQICRDNLDKFFKLVSILRRSEKPFQVFA
jgi:hypothetical protein